MTYNTKYYINNELWQLSPKEKAINTYKTSDGIIIGMFQGNRGKYREIDIKVKILKPGPEEKPFPPDHHLWVVDLMLKINDYRKEVNEIMDFYINFYDELEPFQDQKSRENYKLRTFEEITQKYKHIEQKQSLSIDYVATIIELFCINEKRNDGAVMFKELLKKLRSYTDNKCDYIDLLRAAEPGFKR